MYYGAVYGAVVIPTSTTGTRNARVFPLPVTASTTTSLFPRKISRHDFCTGVGWAKPIEAMKSRIHCARLGVKASHDLGVFRGRGCG